MANFDSLVASIVATINKNGRGAITGNVLQAQLTALIEAVNAKKQDAGEYASPQDVSEAITTALAPYITGDEVRTAIAEAVSGFYTKPQGGIPEGDLSAGVKEKLDKGGTSYQKPTTGIPKDDLAEGVKNALDKAEIAYKKPTTGIPEADLDEQVKSKLNKPVITSYNDLTDKPNIPSKLSELSGDASHRTITDAERNAWNGKQNAIDDLASIREHAEKVTELERKVDELENRPVVDKDLTERVANLEDVNRENKEAFIENMDNLGDVRVKSVDMDELPKVSGYPLFVFGSGAPTVAPDFVPQFYIDTTGHKIYIADGTANASSFRILN